MRLERNMPEWHYCVCGCCQWCVCAVPVSSGGTMTGETKPRCSPLRCVCVRCQSRHWRTTHSRRWTQAEGRQARWWGRPLQHCTVITRRHSSTPHSRTIKSRNTITWIVINKVYCFTPINSKDIYLLLLILLLAPPPPPPHSHSHSSRKEEKSKN